MLEQRQSEPSSHVQGETEVASERQESRCIGGRLISAFSASERDIGVVSPTKPKAGVLGKCVGVRRERALVIGKRR